MRTFLLVLVLAACNGDPGVSDANVPDTPSICASDIECDDGQYCNGAESCQPDDPGADTRGCLGGEAPCDEGSCDDVARTCRVVCPDADGDGAFDSACGGGDCDDDDPNRYPGNTEVCDVDDVDEDCDPATFGFRDADGDGVADVRCCNVLEGAMTCGTDCDDAAPGTNPTVPEVCDGLDRDCDGSIDEGVLTRFVPDEDGDGYGTNADDAPTIEACTAPDGYAELATDCDDARAEVNPAALEECDGEDDNCDGVTDPGCECVTPGASRSCGFSDVGECRLGSQTCVSGTWTTCAGAIGPTSGELACDGRDEDCDGTTDEGELTTCWPDGDADGYAAASAVPSFECTCGAGSTTTAPTGTWIDCDDTNPARYPTADELCDRFDSDCSQPVGSVEPNEDFDQDGHAPIGSTCAGGFPADDCADHDPDAYPGQTAYFGRALIPPVSGSTPNFDFNCDGINTRVTDTRMPVPSACGAMSCASGYTWSLLVSGACGTLVTQWSCHTCTCGRFCTDFDPTTQMTEMPCR